MEDVYCEMIPRDFFVGPTGGSDHERLGWNRRTREGQRNVAERTEMMDAISITSKRLNDLPGSAVSHI